MTGPAAQRHQNSAPQNSAPQNSARQNSALKSRLPPARTG